MRYVDSTSIGALPSILARSTNMPGNTGIGSLLFGLAGAKHLSKAQRKKLVRRRYRMFVDNVIMHHKRLHDRNRQITIDMVQRKIKEKKDDKKKSKEQLEKKNKNKWRNKYIKHGRTLEIKDRINARRIRAKSGWRAMIDAKRNNNDPDL